jgi:hypothetical protein
VFFYLKRSLIAKSISAAALSYFRNIVEKSDENYRREARRHREVEARQYEMLENFSGNLET